MQKKIGLIETGAGNLHSLESALKKLDCTFQRINNSNFDNFDLLLVPGQGRFGSVMKHWQTQNIDRAIKNWISAGGAYVGICVGMQVLFRGSEEDPNVDGLGFFHETVTRLQSPKQPMMGWSTIENRQGQCLLAPMYFVNSYVAPINDYTIGIAEYGQIFSAIVRKDNVVACQFHPEKSGLDGLRCLQSWLY